MIKHTLWEGLATSVRSEISSKSYNKENLHLIVYTNTPLLAMSQSLKPPKLIIVFTIFLDDCNTQEKLETILVHFLSWGGGNKVYYGNVKVENC